MNNQKLVLVSILIVVISGLLAISPSMVENAEAIICQSGTFEGFFVKSAEFCNLVIPAGPQGPQGPPGSSGLSQINDANSYHVNGTTVFATAASTFVSADAICDPGDRVLSGGYSIFDGGVPVFPGSMIQYSFLKDNTQTGWHVIMLAANSNSGINAFAICFDNPPAHIP